MPLNDKIKERIIKRFGNVDTLGDCERLAVAISEDVRKKYAAAGLPPYNCSISRNTVARILGVNDRPRTPQAKTMDVIAVYLGYKDGKDLAHALGETYDVSAFESVDGIDVKALEKGDMVHIAYDPKRDIIMTYLGNDRFVVNESVNSKLQVGDELTITHFELGFELLATNVTRDNENLGEYRSAKCGGLKTVELL